MITVDSIHHVKIPVSDAAASRDWYLATFDLLVLREWHEDGRLVGVALQAPGHDGRRRLSLALREDPERAHALAGFDALALAVTGGDDIRRAAASLEQRGIPHRLVTGSDGTDALVGIHDPDGIEVRIFALA
jgi:catechol 2,3-dioxygenase-like lactoylglutathione lyase family enzyme